MAALVLWQNSDHHVGNVVWVSDLEERILVRKALFTVGAEVEVFVDSALVTDSNDWAHSAPIALHLLVNCKGIARDLFGLFLLWNTFNDWSLQDLLEDILGLALKFLLDEVFEGFAVHALVTGSFLLALFADSLLLNSGLLLRGRVDHLNLSLGLHLEFGLGLLERCDEEDDLLSVLESNLEV